MQSAPTSQPQSKVLTPEYRAKWVVYTQRLLVLTVIWNMAEGAVSVGGAIDSRAAALLAFGLDSFIEVASSIIVLIHMSTELVSLRARQASEDGAATGTVVVVEEPSPDDTTPLLGRIAAERGPNAPIMSLEAERRSTQVIGALLVLLGLCAFVGGVIRLATQAGPSNSLWGIMVSSISLGFMLIFWWYKTKAAVILNSSTLTSDANCALGCLKLSSILLVGSLLFAISNKLWWVDAVTVMLIALNVGKEGYDTIQEARKPEFAGGCGCCSGSDTALAKYMRKQLQLEAPPSAADKNKAGGCSDGCCSGEAPAKKPEADACDKGCCGGGDKSADAGCGGDCCDDELPDDFFSDDE